MIYGHLSCIESGFLINYININMKAVILAGGENRRLQKQKGLLEINGRRFIEIISELFQDYFKSVYISTNNPEVYWYLGHPLIGDIIDCGGPMSGIFSALACSGAPEIFVAACDMPFINRNVMDVIAGHYKGQDAVVPVYNGKPQPLPAIYSGKIMGLMEERIKSDKRSLTNLLRDVNVGYIKEEEILNADPDGRSFININTMDDYLNVQ